MADINRPPSPFATPSGVAIPTTEDQKQLWTELEQRGFFNIEPYIYNPLSGEKFADTWYSKLGLNPFLHVPSIPGHYAKEWLEDRVLYLWGFPNFITKQEMLELLDGLYNIDRLPQLIDTTSQETFRWIILKTKEDKTRFVNMFSQVTSQADRGQLLALPAFAPGRGMIIQHHVGMPDSVPRESQQSDNTRSMPPRSFSQAPSENTQAHVEQTRGAAPLSLEASFEAQLTLSNRGTVVNTTQTRGVIPLSFDASFEAQLTRSNGGTAVNTAQPRWALQQGLAQMATQVARCPQYPPGLPRPGSVNYQNPAQFIGPRDFTYSESSSISETPTRPGIASRNMMSLYETPSRIMENVDFKGQDKVKGNPAGINTGNETRPQHSEHPSYHQFAQPGSALGTGSFRQSYGYQNPYEDANPSQTNNIHGAPVEGAQKMPADYYLALIRKHTGRGGTTNEAAPAALAPIGTLRAVVPALQSDRVPIGRAKVIPEKQAQSISAHPRMTPQQPSLVIEEKAPKVSKVQETPKKPVTLETPKPQTQAANTHVAPAANNPPAQSSWATIASRSSPGSKMIDLASNNKPAAPRPEPTPTPSGSNPNTPEPLVNQMRVVFLLDIPGTITLNDVSTAITEGPLRSIHFAHDEQTKGRYCCIIFQHAIDAGRFTNVLLKERADSKPGRFKFIVDVTRGGEPFPTDQVLEAMEAPLYATRRLTVVKASFFFLVNERILRAKVEKLVGESAIQLIWLYNGGNATIIFSDVGSAIIVKQKFDKWARTAGQPNGADLAWKDLQTGYSRDPTSFSMELKTAL